ncbi:S1C family serine protease [Zavarzinia sp. CC-PAN008]|uniref:S1C family serine protease n=1 Tax=Zavarzinia sp. CC-PAN008 TaxID=3243332 RepID=UPI003F747394
MSILPTIALRMYDRDVMPSMRRLAPPVMGALMRMGRSSFLPAAALALGALLLAAPGVQAEEGDFCAAGWCGGPHFRGQDLSSCIMSSRYEGGIELGFILDRDFNYGLFFRDPDLRLRRNAFRVSFRVDRGDVMRADATLEDETVLIDLGSDPGLFEALRRGSSVGVDFGPLQRRYSLDGTARGLQALAACVARYMDGPKGDRDRDEGRGRAEAALDRWSGPGGLDPAVVEQPAALAGARADPETIYEQVSGSVYVVLAQDDGNPEQSQGSAVAISRRHLLTNCHVVEDHPGSIAIMGKNGTGKARLVAADPAADRCVIRSEDIVVDPVPGIRLDDALRVGETVYTIGAPFGLSGTLGQGLISGLRENEGRPYIQTTAPISPGSSGGGLFDSRGNLIGITTFLLRDGQSLNFAIPVATYWGTGGGGGGAIAGVGNAVSGKPVAPASPSQTAEIPPPPSKPTSAGGREVLCQVGNAVGFRTAKACSSAGGLVIE